MVAFIAMSVGHSIKQR